MFAATGFLAESLPDTSRMGQPLNRVGLGWLYAPLVEGVAERRASSQHSEASGTETPLLSENAIAGTAGTGIVIGKNLVITSRPVVEDDILGKSIQVMIHRSGVGGIPSAAGRVIAISERDNLALVEAEIELEIPAVAITQEFSSDLIAAGPKYILDGKLATSAATLYSLPMAAGLSTFSTNGEFTPGAPLVNSRGQLLGICDSRYLGQISSRHKAIPSSRIHTWLASIDHQPVSEEPQASPSGKAENSVVRLTGLYPASHLGLQDVLPPAMRNARSEFEDQSCVHCNGFGYIPCSARGCAGGSVTTMDAGSATILLPNNAGTMVVPRASTRQTQCRVCSGDGRLKCAVCNSKGINPDIR